MYNLKMVYWDILFLRFWKEKKILQKSRLLLIFLEKIIKISCTIGNNVLISFSDRQMYLIDVLFEGYYGKWT